MKVEDQKPFKIEVNEDEYELIQRAIQLYIEQIARYNGRDPSGKGVDFSVLMGIWHEI